jgi:hypothetical protein
MALNLLSPMRLHCYQMGIQQRLLLHHHPVIPALLHDGDGNPVLLQSPKRNAV